MPRKLDRLRLESRLLEQLAAQTVQRVLPFLEEAARNVPEPGRRIGGAPAQQDAPVLLDQGLGAGHGVRPRDEAAGRALDPVLDVGERRGAARAVQPAVEHPHDRRA
jgi:hypothetical protein